jgi:hypothetical protein
MLKGFDIAIWDNFENAPISNTRRFCATLSEVLSVLEQRQKDQTVVVTPVGQLSRSDRDALIAKGAYPRAA